MKKKRYTLRLRTKIFLALLFLGYFGITMLKQEIKLNEQKAEIQHLKEQIAETEEVNAELERLIEYTESEEFIEKVARERLGWVKKGEIIFIEKKKD
ncbi:MAG: septum formation initiator family protein [Clostridiales bacterium]|jgi:cell division protein FtsB|nr:septum formation initiator family protein [Clostridiales bacterium]